MLVVLLEHPLHGHYIPIAQSQPPHRLLTSLWPIGAKLKTPSLTQGEGYDADVAKLSLEELFVVSVPSD